MESTALLIAASLNAGTVLAIASLGLLINEKAGIVNLGAEGMMLCAALAGFATVVHTGSTLAGFGAGMLAGAALAVIFGPYLFGQVFARFVGPGAWAHLPGAPFLLASALLGLALVVAWRVARAPVDA